MIEKKILKTKNYAQIVQNFAEQNFNLKMLCTTLFGLLFLMLILVLYLIKQGPMVIALAESGKVARIETKVTDLQIEEAIEEYISLRYNWTYENIDGQLKKAEFFVSSGLIGSFRKSMISVQKFVNEKKVKQRVYPRSIEVDLKEKRATVIADRITEFESLKAATEMGLTLHFSTGSRSVANPWGIFVTKEVERGEK